MTDPRPNRCHAVVTACWPRVVATLVRLLGDIEAAEEAAQEATVTALERWPGEGVPDNPTAWLVTVGRNRFLDTVRRARRHAELSSRVPVLHEVSPPDAEVAVSSLADDDLLRLVFTCCNAELPAESRIALTLKVVLGFDVAAIARALLASETAVERRLSRARRTLAAAAVPQPTPTDAELPARLDDVLRVIYLMFNEGYSRLDARRTHGADLVGAAIRLARMITRLFRHHPEARALLALMLLGEARMAARLDDAGDFVPLDRQDRSRWNPSSRNEGIALINSVYAARHPAGPYQIQAAISALHAEARAEDTDWHQIVALYTRLLGLQPTSVVRVNLAVAALHAGAEERAMEALEAAGRDPAMQDYAPFFAARGLAAAMQERLADARSEFDRAAALTDSPVEKRWLARCVADPRNALPAATPAS